MDQYLNNRQNEILWKLLANPADNGQLYTYNLQSLVKDFPQSGLLQALLARSDREQHISHAAAYFDPRLLYNLANYPDSLALVTDGQVIQQLSDTVEYAAVNESDLVQSSEEVSKLNDLSEDNIEATPEIAVEEDEQPLAEEHHAEELTEVTQESEIEHITDSVPEEIQELATETEPVNEEEAEAVTVMEHEEVQGPPTEESEPVNEEAETHHEHEDIQEPLSEEDTVVEAVTDMEHEEVQEPSIEEAQPITITPENEHFYEDELVTEAGTYEEDLPQEAVELSSVEAGLIQEPSGAGEDQSAETVDEDIKEEELVTEPSFFKLEESPKDIDDDVYDEIVGIENINFTSAAKPTGHPAEIDNHLAVETNTNVEEPTGEATNEPSAEAEQKERALNLDDEAEKLIVGNIAATDYFAFDRAVGDRKQADETESALLISSHGSINEPVGEAALPGTENQNVSKYHDDKMPYTFMWWLDKTRKEHAGIYQPFKLDTSQAIRQSGAEELQQQYYENIFHINSVEELDRSTSSPTVEFDTKRKEDVIIKRFITEEPHIKPPSIDKLDTENKAKKSAEDQDEMVTETLARVYSDQMLYHKAINTYKKLMLKFPEKSRYFADQIEQLERKTN